AASRDGSAGVDGLLKQVDDCFELVVVDHGSNVCALVEGIADCEALGGVDDSVDKLVLNSVVDEDTLDAVAHLSGIRTRAADNARRSFFDVGVFPNNSRIIPAEFERDLLHATILSDILPDIRTACEGDGL